MTHVELVRPRAVPGARWVRVAAHLAIPALLVANAAWFPLVVGTGYFRWYLEQGLVLGLAGSFVAMIVEDLEAEAGLISANPADYFASCLQLTGAVFFALSTDLSPSSRGLPPGAGAGAAARVLWDAVATAVLAVLVAALTLAWMLVVAPLNYLATLVAGAPARHAVHGPRRPVYGRLVGSQLAITEARDPDAPAPDGVRLSLARRPLAVTQALIALLLGLASLAG